MVSPLGVGTEQNFRALRAERTGLRVDPAHPNMNPAYVGRIPKETLDQFFNGSLFPRKTSRIQRMVIAALAPLLKKKNIDEHSLLILATTKGNVNALATGQQEKSDIPTLGQNIASYFGFHQPPLIVNHACVSGLMALSVAKRYLQMELFSDAYLVAVDELSDFVQSGFHSFQALSPHPCRPYDRDRQGVNLGEAAAACYVSCEKLETSIRIAGDANINDANHISGPSRTGEGLFLSINNALKEAEVRPEQIDYIVGHGTATLYNDDMEAIAFNRAGLAQVPLSGFKGYFGHTLGASGLLEGILTAACLRNNYLIGTIGFNALGTSMPIDVLKHGRADHIQVALKTASGFGGSNSAILLIKD